MKDTIQSQIYQYDTHTMAVHYTSIEQFKRYYKTVEDHCKRLKAITSIKHIIEREIEQ